jgi:hypothetical protein
MADLRQWCRQCQAPTRSWIDIWGDTRCQGCDPEDPRNPGCGIRDGAE